MKVAEEKNAAIALQVLDQILEVEYWRVLALQRSYPAPVHVVPRKSTTVVTIDDPIWIQHRNNFEYKFASKLPRLSFVTQQEVNQPLHHVLRVGLARVHPRRHYHCFALGHRYKRS